MLIECSTNTIIYIYTKDISSLNNLTHEIMLFCLGRNGKHAFADLKKIFRGGGGVGMGTFCLPREGAISKRFFFIGI